MGVILLKLQIAFLMLNLASLTGSGMDNAILNAKNAVSEATQYMQSQSVPTDPNLPQNSQIQGGTVPEATQTPVIASCTVSFTTRELRQSEIDTYKAMQTKLPPGNLTTHVIWTMVGIPDSVRGKILTKDDQGNWVDSGFGLTGQDHQTDVAGNFPNGLMADFNGVQCQAN